MADDVAAWVHSVKAVTRSIEGEGVTRSIEGVRRAAAAAMAAARPWVPLEEAALERSVEATLKLPFESTTSASQHSRDITAANANSRAAPTAQLQHQVLFFPFPLPPSVCSESIRTSHVLHFCLQSGSATFFALHTDPVYFFSAAL